MTHTLYWHDYESWGADPRRDRPVQFAGLRTDLDLNPLGEPLTLYCRPPPDALPSPQACLITGITPQLAERQGVCEAEFISRIHEELARAGTCAVGYNSIRFDDELTRHALYRNFFDPYAREWQNGNSRWDIIDLVRMARALRPGGVRWPSHPDGAPSNRLEDMTAANGIEHAGAHDALADVRATIELARLLRRAQPRLYDWFFGLRDKRRVAPLLDCATMKPVLHVSGMYPAEHGCLAVVAPLAPHPTNRNGVIVFDLRYDPRPFAGLDAEAIRERLFTPAAELPEGQERIPLKTVHLNKSPALAPLSTLTPEAAARWDIDLERARRHLELLRAVDGLGRRVQLAHGAKALPPADDPELALYDGFFPDADRARIARVRATPPPELGRTDFGFEDARLPGLLFRYRARNFPDTLGAAERERWRAHCRTGLTGGIDGVAGLDAYLASLEDLRSGAQGERDVRILDALEAHARHLAREAGLEDAPA
ncbi:MAG: exodeoxyribonuclease I [Chromatiales bacterium]